MEARCCYAAEEQKRVVSAHGCIRPRLYQTTVVSDHGCIRPRCRKSRPELEGNLVEVYFEISQATLYNQKLIHLQETVAPVPCGAHVTKEKPMRHQNPLSKGTTEGECSWCNRGLAALAMAALLAMPAHAAKPPADDDTRPRQILPEEDQRTIRRGNQRVHVETGAPVALYQVGHAVTPGTPRAMATEYLQAAAAQLRLASDLKDLEHRATWTSPAGSTVRYQQQVNGIPVLGADLAVTIAPDSTVSFVMNSYRPELGKLDTSPRLGELRARGMALKYLGIQGDVRFEGRRLVVYPGATGPRLAWQIKVVPAGEPVGDWEVLIDAHDGEMFKVVDNSYYVEGNGNVFDPDPLSSSGSAYGDPGYTDGNDADTPELTSQLQNVILRDLTLNGGTYSLVGPYAEIVDSENPKLGLFSQTSSSFNYTRNQSGFEAVHTYFHIDHMMRYINETLGLAIMPYQYSGGVRFDPHGLSGSDNSHYITSVGELAFGEGGVDDAEDADVVIHELGHGLHDWVTNGGLSQVNGLSEGTGDYIAQSYSRFLNQWGPSDQAYQWVFHWDGHNPFWGGRTTGYGAVYPGGLTGSIHTDGQIWSTCNMKIWDLLGREKTDKAFLAGLGMTNGSTNQEDAAQAVLQAAVNMGYSGADIVTMESTYQSCGYNVTAPCSATCGNGVLECGEVCDGGELGGMTCGDFGCSGGGVLACNNSCDGFDTSGCITCPLCDNDGTCEFGEDCLGCPNDCASGSTSGAVCGNGICEAGDGEDCVSCAQDCNGVQGGKPGNRFCCGDGGGTNPVSCSDPRCTSGGFSCTDIPGTAGSFCCGTGGCEGGESCSNCALDCSGSFELCADGIDNDCDGDTDCSDSECSGDPACSGGCSQSGDACTVNSDCCSNRCRGNGTCK